MVKTSFKFGILSRILKETIPNSLYRPMKQQHLLKNEENEKRQKDRLREKERVNSAIAVCSLCSVVCVCVCVCSTTYTSLTVNVSLPGEWRSPWEGALLTLSLSFPTSLLFTVCVRACVCVCVCVCVIPLDLVRWWLPSASTSICRTSISKPGLSFLFWIISNVRRFGSFEDPNSNRGPAVAANAKSIIHAYLTFQFLYEYAQNNNKAGKAVNHVSVIWHGRTWPISQSDLNALSCTNMSCVFPGRNETLWSVLRV